jgi:ribonuclease P/MRP protein subunit POP5
MFYSDFTSFAGIGTFTQLFSLILLVLVVLGSIKACKVAALKCDEMKFEHYKLAAGAPLSPDVNQHMQNCLEKIKILEH